MRRHGPRGVGEVDGDGVGDSECLRVEPVVEVGDDPGEDGEQGVQGDAGHSDDVFVHVCCPSGSCVCGLIIVDAIPG